MMDQSPFRQFCDVKNCIARSEHLFFPEANFKAWDVLHSERESISDNDCTYAVLSVKEQLPREHERYKYTVGTTRSTTVV